MVEEQPVTAIAGEQQQEGLAGAFSGYSHGVLLACRWWRGIFRSKTNYTNGKFTPTKE